MRLLLIVLSEKLIVDSRSSQVTAVNLIDEISSTSFPAWVSNPTLMLTLHKDDGDVEEGEGTLRFLIDDDEIVSSSFLFDFGGLPRARTIIELNGMVIPRPGHLKVCVRYADQQLGEWDILATQLHEADETSLSTEATL